MARRRLPFDARTLAALNLYVFIPSLIFASLSRSTIEWSVFGRCAVGTVLVVVCTTGLMAVVAKLRKLDHESKNAFLMTLFPNLGNFGLPVVSFAFGEDQLPLALVILVCGSFLQNTVGIYFAQRNSHGVVAAFWQVFRFPMLYAFALAIAFQQFEAAVPETVVRAIGMTEDGYVFRAIALTAEAAIPVQLMILGVKLAETTLQSRTDVVLAALLRLCAGPVIAFAMALLVGLEGISAKVFILQISGPTAVAMAVYGIQFNVKPGFLASAVSLSFLLSIVTVSIVLSILYAVNL